jgi:hypothetical protein
MKQKIKFFLLGAIILSLSALAFCSCRAAPHITLDCENLPDGYSMEVLLQLDEEDSDYSNNAESGYIYSDAVTPTGSDSDSSSYTYTMTAEDITDT